MTVELVVRQLPRRREDGERDRQVVTGALLAQTGRREVDGHASARKLELRGQEPAAGSLEDDYDGDVRTSTSSKYSPARRPVRRLTWRRSRSSSRSPARSRISGYRSRRSLTTTQRGAPGASAAAARASARAMPSL